MSKQGAVADLPVLPARLAFAAATAVLSLASSVAFAGVRNTATFVVPFALLYGLICWVLQRGSQRRSLQGLTLVLGTGRRGQRSALLQGFLWAATVTVAGGACVALGRLWGLDNPALVPVSVLLGSAVWVALEAYDLARWQRLQGLVAHTRVGTLWFLPTSIHATEQLVAVR